MSNQATIPGCPTIRALAFNESGVIKGIFCRPFLHVKDNPLWWLIVIESDVERPGIARVVEKWGDLDSSKSVVATSLIDGNLNRAMGAELPPPNITVQHFHNQYFYYYPAPAAGGNPPPPAAVVNNALPLVADDNNPPLPAAALNNAPAASVDNLPALAASDNNAPALAAASDNNQQVVAPPFSSLTAIESAEDVGNL